MKKIGIGISIVLAIVIVLGLPYWINDIACISYKKDIESTITNISDVKVLDMLNGCGNIANGNHTHLIVTALVESDLPEESVKNKFPDAHDVIPYELLYYETKTSEQFKKHITDDTKNYYVLVYAKSAPFYYIDFRGH